MCSANVFLVRSGFARLACLLHTAWFLCCCLLAGEPIAESALLCVCFPCVLTEPSVSLCPLVRALTHPTCHRFHLLYMFFSSSLVCPSLPRSARPPRPVVKFVQPSDRTLTAKSRTLSSTRRCETSATPWQSEAWNINENSHEGAQ